MKPAGRQADRAARRVVLNFYLSGLDILNDGVVRV